ncbi:MAG: RsiV family protein [Clostridia bacterium]|nr:RsiV family protein [Clostridia bacterium]
MTKKYILALSIFFVFIILTYFVGIQIENGKANVKAVYNNIESIENCTMEQITENNNQYHINIYYPVTKYDKLNIAIKKLVDDKLNIFKDYIGKSADLIDKVFTLDIKFNISSYNEFISVEFDVFYDFAGAHPITNTYTISYNTKGDKIIMIEDLMKKNDQLLNKLHDYFSEKLKNNDKIKEYYNEQMFEDGLRPMKENFENFIFTKDGLIFIFNRYQIAPYVAGETRELIPYDKIII